MMIADLWEELFSLLCYNTDPWGKKPLQKVAKTPHYILPFKYYLVIFSIVMREFI